MNPLNISSILPKTRLPEILVATTLGVLGLLLNTIELPLGWGAHFVFGNAIAFAFIRVLAPRTLVLAIAISSLGAIFLWHHPWVWLVCLAEAVFIGFFAGKSSPVRSDAVFWLVLGAPLLLVNFGMLTQMDEMSVLLEVLKQSINGILNVVLGELLYVSIIRLNPRKRFGRWPKLNVESAVITVLMSVILIPTTVYLAIDAPGREEAERQRISSRLEDRLSVSKSALDNWIQSRSLLLRMHIEEEVNKGALPKQDYLQKVASDFQELTITAQGKKLYSAASSDGVAVRTDKNTAQQKIPVLGAQRLVAAVPKDAGQGIQYTLIVPFNAAGQSGEIESHLRANFMEKLLDLRTEDMDYSVILVSPSQGAFPVTPVPTKILQAITTLPAVKRNESLRTPLLISDSGDGGAEMSDFRAAHMLRSAISTEVPEWHLIAIAPLGPASINARKTQLKQFVVVSCLVLLVMVVASTLGRNVTRTLRRLRQSAADISSEGAVRIPMDAIVVHELNEISGTIVSTSTAVGQDRGALARYERRLNSIGEHAPVIVYGLEIVEGRKGPLIFVSGSLDKILGYDSSEAMQPGWWSHSIHPDDYQCCVDAFRSLTANKVINVEYRLLHKDGHYVWVYDTLSTEPNPSSERFEAIGVIMDISERKAAAEQLLQADKMASLGRMISGTAHELNQPLNFIKMAVSNLRENMVRGRFEPEQFMVKLDNVLAQVERASAIILQMRIFGRVPKEHPYPVDVRAAVDEVTTMVAPQFDLDETQVTISEKGGPTYVQGLPMLLEQVVLNLLLNANDGIKARYGENNAGAGQIKVTVERREQLAVIIVEDNGTGIPADVLRNIFDPFFTTKAPKAGTGLGLSISYGIIRDMGGVIKAKSSPNGARFTIELPLSDGESEQAKSSTEGFAS